MTKVLLISEDFIKTNSALSDNYFGKWLLPAIKSAQDMGLQSIIGTKLYKKLLDLVKTGEIVNEENTNYKTLIDEYVRDYLLYKVLQESVPIANVKISNIGTKLAEDERIISLSQGEADLLQHSFDDKADFYRKRLQNYLLSNYDLFPELESSCSCEEDIKPNLKTSANPTVWLGGLYSKKI